MTTAFSEFVHKGGPTVLLILMLVVPGVALVVLNAVIRRTWSLVAAIVVTVAVLGAGVFGMLSGRSRTDDAVARAESAEEKQMHLEAGYAEAAIPMKFAGVVGGLFAAGIVAGQLRRKR
jgi:hypothetical protein